VTLVIGGHHTGLTVIKSGRSFDDIFTAIFDKFWWRYYPPAVNCLLYPTTQNPSTTLSTYTRSTTSHSFTRVTEKKKKECFSEHTVTYMGLE
jgi:hypothetical protein